ncbi:putative thioredoxin-disulfide reductase [Rosa chinensis]|uniref:Glutaredoxin n=1 Tax=Rosa chinensis TaxID=74649 RepID=A0A2P6P5T4_ROSCH|nr:glutaredoxin [Rosa chinensis]PRQ17276.1 putative thioredoxin-disulfide reductase [Rosa chinensis]
MGSFFSHGFTKEQLAMALEKIKTTVNATPVVVFSKTYCGYCRRVKQLLTQVGARYKVVELDEDVDGGEIEAALAEWTGQSTVPNVFIAGKHIGGCDSVLERHQTGQLLPLLREAGAVANNPMSA